MTSEAEHQDEMVLTGHQCRRALMTERVRMSADVLRHSGHEILSIGSGDGLQERLAALAGRHVVGVDISRVAVEAAKTAAHKNLQRNVSFFCVDAVREMEFDGRWDTVWFLATLHHLPDIPKVLEWSYACLRDGGTVVSIDPNRFRVMGLAKPFTRGLRARLQSPDERSLSPWRLARQYREAGFQMVSIYWLDFFLGPIVYAFDVPEWLYRVLYRIDWMVRSIPGLRCLGSAYMLVARKVEQMGRVGPE